MLKTVGNPSSRTGDQTIVDGNLVIGTAGKGIDFSVNPSAPGMTSELLSDYEQGTWTPVATSSGGGLVVTTVSASGSYTKVGNLVYVTANMVLAITNAGTGTPRITGLPFSAAATAGVIQGIMLAFTTTGSVNYVSTNVVNFEGAAWNTSGSNRTFGFSAVYVV